MAVTAIVEHPALDAVRDGVQAALKEDRLRSRQKPSSGSTKAPRATPAPLHQIARKFIGDKPDAIVAIATPSAQAAVAATKNVPVVFSAVTDPVAAKLMPGWKPPKRT